MSYVSENGKYAKTSYKLLSKRNGLSLVQVSFLQAVLTKLECIWRTLFVPYNDNLYGTPGLKAVMPPRFQATFIHPVSDKPLEITRTLPEDLRKIIYY